jgi:hypothetical protein
MTAYRNLWFLYRTILSLVASFSFTRSKIAISLVIFSAFRNRSYIRRNNRAEEGVFINISIISDGNLDRTIVNKTLLKLNE